MPMGHRDWPKITWKFPLPHDFSFGFGLGNKSITTKQSSMVPYVMQDNAIVDYETIKVNPENEDFAVVQKPNCAAGSYIPRANVFFSVFSTNAEVDVMKLKYMNIHTSMLNRLDAFDKKTGNDIETILELQHETTDEQCYPLWNGTKVYEGHHVNDLPPEVPGLTTTQQSEGVNFDMEMFFDALQYYTNKEMLRQVTDRMQTIHIYGDLSADVNRKQTVYNHKQNVVPSMCKFMHPYTLCAGLFHLPMTSTLDQYQKAAGITEIEQLTVMGRVRFNEFNPDFNYARA